MRIMGRRVASGSLPGEKPVQLDISFTGCAPIGIEPMTSDFANEHTAPISDQRYDTY